MSLDFVAEIETIICTLLQQLVFVSSAISSNCIPIKPGANAGVDPLSCQNKKLCEMISESFISVYLFRRE